MVGPRLRVYCFVQMHADLNEMYYDMKGWTNDDRMMIACCNDGTRPVIFRIERIDIPENDEEREWLAKQNFRNTAEDAYTG